MEVQAVCMDLFERYGPLIMTNVHSSSTQYLEPFYDILGVRHTSAQQQKLGLRRCQRDRQLVIQPSVQITQHLVFVNDQKSRTVALDEAAFLGLQSRYQDRRTEVLRQISCGNAYIPTTRSPFRKFVVGQSTSRHGINRLATILSLV